MPDALSVSLIVIAGITDGLDGFLARQFKLESRLGTWLDPLADKTFAIACVVVLLQHSLLTSWELISLFGRDIALLLFTAQLFLQKRRGGWEVQSFYAGKLATALQFLIFLLLIAGYGPLPASCYVLSGLLGVSSLVELNIRLRFQQIKVQ